MVAFGKKLKELQIQEWKGYYIDYKLLKKKVKQYAQQKEAVVHDRDYVLRDFSQLLDQQIEKIVLFLLKQQGQLATRLSGLADDSNESFSHEPHYETITELRESYREVGRDLLRLLFFVEMNDIGLRKILKKFDKRFGYRFTNYYVKTRANHPYSQLRQVFKQVGISAVVGSITRNLADLQDDQRRYVSIYDHPTLQLSVWQVGYRIKMRYGKKWVNFNGSVLGDPKYFF